MITNKDIKKRFINPFSVIVNMENGKYKKAHMELWKAIKRKDFDKKKIVCENCNGNINLQYHHDDYNKPFSIRVLCGSCHRKLHKAETNFNEAYKKEKRNKYGRFGKTKPIGNINCLNCKKTTEKNNPRQKYCEGCMIKLNTRHLSKKKLGDLK